MSEFEWSTLALVALVLAALAGYSYWQIDRASRRQKANEARLHALNEEALQHIDEMDEPTAYQIPLEPSSTHFAQASALQGYTDQPIEAMPSYEFGAHTQFAQTDYQDTSVTHESVSIETTQSDVGSEDNITLVSDIDTSAQENEPVWAEQTTLSRYTSEFANVHYHLPMVTKKPMVQAEVLVESPIETWTVDEANHEHHDMSVTSEADQASAWNVESSIVNGAQSQTTTHEEWETSDWLASVEQAQTQTNMGLNIASEVTPETDNVHDHVINDTPPRIDVNPDQESQTQTHPQPLAWAATNAMQTNQVVNPSESHLSVRESVVSEARELEKHDTVKVNGAVGEFFDDALMTEPSSLQEAELDHISNSAASNAYTKPVQQPLISESVLAVSSHLPETLIEPTVIAAPVVATSVSAPSVMTPQPPAMMVKETLSEEANTLLPRHSPNVTQIPTVTPVVTTSAGSSPSIQPFASVPVTTQHAATPSQFNHTTSSVVQPAVAPSPVAQPISQSIPVQPTVQSSRKNQMEQASLAVLEPLIRFASWSRSTQLAPINTIDGTIDFVIQQPKRAQDIEKALYDLFLDTDLPLRLYGRRTGGLDGAQWQPLEQGMLYSGLRLTLQLANQSEYAQPPLIQEWFALAQRLAKRLAAQIQSMPDPSTISGYAMYLHDVSKHLTAPLIIQLHKKQGLWPAYEIHQHMTQLGITLLDNGTYQARNDEGRGIYTVMNDVNNPRAQDFYRDQLSIMHAHTLSFCLDLAQVPAQFNAVLHLCQDMSELADTLGAEWINTQGHAISPDMFYAYAQNHVQGYQQQVAQLGLPAGSIMIRRLLQGRA